jgi:hypothetical protein
VLGSRRPLCARAYAFAAGLPAKTRMTSSDKTLAQVPSAILCADWGKEAAKRAVYVADVAGRAVRRVPGRHWSLTGVLVEADRWTSGGAVLVTFDAPLGVPQSYMEAWDKASSGLAPTTFLDLLRRTAVMPDFFEATSAPASWRLERPFFAVPPVAGGRSAYEHAAESLGVTIYRQIDRQTSANSLFIKSGIPGSVGSATCALWRELAELLTEERTFAVWPFEGDLCPLLATSAVVIGEIYPRAAYATALQSAPPALRPRLSVAKTKPDVRLRAINSLQDAEWVRSLGVTLEDLVDAEGNEDDFDACFTAAALLRCVLERSPIELVADRAAPAEGGMLGTGSINLDLPERSFGSPQQAWSPLIARGASRGAVPARRAPGGVPSREASPRTYSCPIPGCGKMYRGSRGGWDSHVASLRIHPSWHPELQDEADRKQTYRSEFPDFFR